MFRDNRGWVANWSILQEAVYPAMVSVPKVLTSPWTATREKDTMHCWMVEGMAYKIRSLSIAPSKTQSSL